MAQRQTASVVTIERRSAVGTTGSNATRRAGKVPGVLYGHGNTTPIALETKAVGALVAAGARTHAVNVSLDGATVSVLLRGVDHDPISRRPISVDLQQIDAGEAIYATIPVVTTGTPIGVKEDGGVLEIVRETVEVKGASEKIPNNVTIDVANLGLHGHVRAGDVPLPDGVVLYSSKDEILVSITAPRGVATPAPAADGAPAAETPATPA